MFHEITKPAITKAIENPRTVNQKLVDAQQARRILDRIVGYKLSPVLWKKIRRGLSAGRVQSVAVRLIVEREREITDFTPRASFKVTAEFTTKDGETLSAELKNHPEDVEATKKLLEQFAESTFNVAEIKKRPSRKNPPAPFTTSSLQQEAARRLGYSVKQTMTVAQRLYESGHITYMRTDSTTLSQGTLKSAKDYITKEFGSRYTAERQYKTKQRNAQEAHEAIRPTNLTKDSAGDNSGQQKLYNLIWQRTIASQMTAAETDRTTLHITPSKTKDEVFLAKGEVLRFEGFMKIYGGGKEDVILPDLSVGDSLDRGAITATENFSNHPPRYSEASLVKKLEELGIGRPSTYAPTITTVQDRGYIEKADLEGEERTHQMLVLDTGSIKETTTKKTYGADKSKLIPTSVALVTTDFLTKHFPSIVDYNFTAKTEKTLDEIADGKTDWVSMLGDFYKDFEPLVEKSENVSREESTQTRKIGTDPSTKLPIFARFGRYGLMLQRGETDSEDKPVFAPMPESKTIDTVTLDDALEMFKLPRLVGKTKDGTEILANIGRFGPYIKIDKLYVSIKPLDPMTITLEEALERYNEKLTQEKNKHIKEFKKSGLSVLNGPYGPYITNGKKNARIPKSIEPKDITEAQAKEIIKKAKPSKKRYRKTTKK